MRTVHHLLISTVYLTGSNKIKISLISRDVVTAGIDGGYPSHRPTRYGAKGTITRGVQGHAPPENFEI